MAEKDSRPLFVKKPQPLPVLSINGSWSAFTLLEVLLTTVLSATLVLGAWSLLNIYVQLFETGQSKTEQSQLVRSLMQQISDDLHGAIQDTTPRQSSGSTSVRRFGLLGSPHQLRFDVLQVTPLGEAAAAAEDVMDDSRGVSAAQVPELRTVMYTFQEPRTADDVEVPGNPNASDDVDVEDLRGLVRRELDFETPAAEPPAVALDDSITWAPEVWGLEFRYFDGSGWSSQWNSLLRKSLPVAVEVAMQVSARGEPRQRQSADEEAQPDDEELTAGDQTESEDTGDAIYRLVVDVPSATLHRAPHRPRQRIAALRATVPRPRPAARPAPRPPWPDRRVNAADQWMRTKQ